MHMHTVFILTNTFYDFTEIILALLNMTAGIVWTGRPPGMFLLEDKDSATSLITRERYFFISSSIYI
jgi:hypothetical protein